jgi:hypothetical protein
VGPCTASERDRRAGAEAEERHREQQQKKKKEPQRRRNRREKGCSGNYRSLPSSVAASATPWRIKKFRRVERLFSLILGLGESG